MFKVYIHLNDLFVTYPSTHAPAFGGGETLTPGVYSIGGAGSLGGAITLDGGGNPDAFFVIKFYGAMTAGAGAVVNLTNGAKSCNVFWIAEGAISVAANANIKGTLFARIGAVGLGAGAVLEGRMLTLEGALTTGVGASVSPPPLISTIPIFCESGCSSTASVDVLGVLSNFALYTNLGAVANTSTSGIDGNIGTDVGGISGYSSSVMVGTFNTADALTAQANIDLNIAYTSLMALPNTVLSHAPAFGTGETINAGVYFIAGAGSLAGTITLDGQNNPNAIFVFKFAGAFSVGAQSKIILANGARRCNVFWIGGAGVATGAVTMGAGSVLKGTFLSHGGACSSGDGLFLAGRQLSTGGAVNTYSGIIYNNPVCVTSTSLSTHPILAVVDNTPAVNGLTGGTTPALTLNDNLNGTPVVIGIAPGNVTLTGVTVPTGLTLNANGTVTIAPNTPAGNYSLTYKICEVTNPTNCSSVTSTIVVSAPAILAVVDAAGPINGTTGGTKVVNVLSNDILNGIPVSIAQVNLTTVTPNANLTLNANGSVDVAPNLPAGIYTLTYRICEKLNPINCDQAIVTINVVCGQIQTPTVSITQPTCTTTIGTITVTAPTGTGLTYSINSSTYQSGTSFSGLASGSYYVTVRNFSGCVSTATAAVINAQPATPTAPAAGSVTQPTCTVATGSFSITNYNAAFTYVVTPSTGVSVSGSTVTATAGTYTVTATLGACTSIASANVTVNAQPAIPAQPTLGTVIQPTCTVAKGSFTITNYNAAYTYIVTPSTGVSISGSTITAPAGIYTIKATLGSCPSIASLSVTVNAQTTSPVAATVSITQPTCTTSTGTIKVTAPIGTGLTYSINSSTYKSGTSFAGLTSGSYSVTVKNSTGCVSSVTVAVINAQPATPAQPTLCAVTQPTCTKATGSFSITNYNAAYTYTVTPSTGVSVSGSTITAPAGTYTVKAKLGACNSIASASVTVNAQTTSPSAATVSIAQPTCTIATGTITVTAPTGTGLNYSINSTTYQSGTSFAGLASGSYSVTVKNANGCVSTAIVAVINAQPTPCNNAGIYHTTKTCADYINNPGSQLVGQLCYTTDSSKITNVTPGQFFYFTTITAPSASFCIDIVETQSSNSLALFAIQQSNQITLWNASCSSIATGIQISLGLGRVCISNAIPGTQYVMSVKYDSKSVIGVAYKGTAPSCLYLFESKINGVTIAGSSTSINMVPNCVAKMSNEGVGNEADYSLNSFPNPFSEKFGISLQTQSNERINVLVYDVLGKLLDKKQVLASELEQLSLGINYSSGVYLLVVSQGAHIKKLHIIKK